MSVEGGSSAGATATGGPDAPSLGGIRGGIAALEATVPLGPVQLGRFSLDREGPVAPEALNTMAIVAKSISPKILGEIVFKPSIPSVIEQAEVVATAAWEKSKLPASTAKRGEPTPAQVASQAEAIISQAAVIPDVIPANAGIQLKIQAEEKLLDPRLRGDDNKIVMPQVKPVVLPWVEPASALQVSPAPLPQPLFKEQAVEEIVTEKVTKEETGLVEEEEMVEKRMYLEDEQVLAQRRCEIGQAVKKAKAEADRLGLLKIAGWLVAKFLPAEHPGNRSQVVKEKGPDGSYQETVEAIAGAGQLESEEEAIEKFDRVVAAKKPVKYGENGTPVGSEDVARVFKYHVVKPETSLEDDPELAEVFGKSSLTE